MISELDPFTSQTVVMPEISEENDSEDEENLVLLDEPVYENLEWQTPNYDGRLRSMSMENLSKPKLYPKANNKY